MSTKTLDAGSATVVAAAVLYWFWCDIIGSRKPAPAPIKRVPPHQKGWLRRPELDGIYNSQVWEMPIGLLYLHYGDAPLMLAVKPRKPPQ